jgi:hypothetical protein
MQEAHVMTTASIFSTKAWFDFRSFDVAAEPQTSIPYLKMSATEVFVSSTDVDGTPVIARWSGVFILPPDGSPPTFGTIT